MNEAERYLLDRIRQGDADAWSQVVHRYQGRLVAFAQLRLRAGGDAEDLVQDTFLAFLKGLGAYRGEGDLESYLFTTLRRKIISLLRGRKFNVCLLQDVLHGEAGAGDAFGAIPGDEPTASWYARRDEDEQRRRRALASALAELVEPLKAAQDFVQLQTIEMLFYGQLPNKEIARLMALPENRVALIKHRSLKQVRSRVAACLGTSGGSTEPGRAEHEDDALLTAVWEEHRFSCLKRSAIGAYLLGTLEAPWQAFADFHLNRLGCRFCLANLDDLRSQDAPRQKRTLQQRIMQSTIGFLRVGD